MVRGGCIAQLAFSDCFQAASCATQRSRDVALVKDIVIVRFLAGILLPINV
jgi:ABC-type uncharacterized transport system permease subunit